jgi:hypothetical protein
MKACRIRKEGRGTGEEGEGRDLTCPGVMYAVELHEVRAGLQRT